MNVVITGASRGMGKAIAEKYAGAHHNLFLCSRNDAQLYKAMEELLTNNPGISVKAKAADLSKPAEAKDFGAWVLAETKKLPGHMPHILVNNAGQFEPGSIYNEGEGVLENMIEVNLYSAYHLTRAILPAMMENRSGHIFNMCSIASLHAYPNGGAYSISKFALLGFSKNLREEMTPFGIKVTAVLPGAVYTDSWSASDVSPDRIMKVGDIADMIFAASQLSHQAVVEDIIIRPQLGDL